MSEATPDQAQTRDFAIMELMRYALRLEMLERNADLDDGAAISLLRSELALAQNAGYFDDLTAEDIELGAISRSRPQEGVGCYVVDLLLEERSEGLDDDGALTLVRRAFAGALNASYLLKTCTDDQITVTLVSRGSSAHALMSSAA